MEEDGSRSPQIDSSAKRPRLSSYSGALYPGDGGSHATPARSIYDVPATNGRPYSPQVPGSVPNGDGTRVPRHDTDIRQHHSSRNDMSRHDDRYQPHDRCEVSIRDLNGLYDLVDRLQREVRTLRSRLDGVECRVNVISGSVDTFR